MPVHDPRVLSLAALFAKSSLVGQGITLFILALLVVGLIAILRSWLELSRDWDLLGADARQTPEPADLQCPLLRAHYELLVGWRSKAEAAIAAIQGLNAVQLEVANAFPRWLARIFLMLGLLGTVWGLGSSIASLSTQSTPGSLVDGSPASLREASQLSQRLLQSFAHMETVFLCTAAGIVAAVVMTGANSLYSWKHGRYVAEAERYTVRVLAPAVVTEAMAGIDATPEGWAEASRRVGETFAQMQAAMTELNTLTKTVSDSLGQGMSTLQASVSGLSDMTGNLNQATTVLRQATDELKPVLADVSQEHEASRQLLGDVQRQLEAMDGRLADAGQQLEARLAQAAQEMSGALVVAGGSLAGAAENIQNAAKTASDSAVEVARTLDATRQALEGISQESGTHVLEGLDRALANFQAALDHAEQVGAEHLRRTTQDQLEQLGIVRYALELLAEQVSDEIARLGEIGDQAVAAVPRRLEEIEAGQRELRSAVDRLGHYPHALAEERFRPPHPAPPPSEVPGTQRPVGPSAGAADRAPFPPTSPLPPATPSRIDWDRDLPGADTMIPPRPQRRGPLGQPQQPRIRRLWDRLKQAFQRPPEGPKHSRR